MISFKHRGSFDALESWLRSVRGMDIRNLVEPYARQGVYALASATPTDTGVAASAWDYEIQVRNKTTTIRWLNYNREGNFPVVIMLQYGYATGTGGYVHGRDFINPAIQPIFDSIADAVWKVVTSS